MFRKPKPNSFQKRNSYTIDGSSLKSILSIPFQKQYGCTLEDEDEEIESTIRTTGITLTLFALMVAVASFHPLSPDRDEDKIRGFSIAVTLAFFSGLYAIAGCIDIGKYYRARAIAIENNKKIGERFSRFLSKYSMVNPLTCPISRKKMTDPVFCTIDCHTYERSTIEELLKKRGVQKLDKVLVKDYSLKACLNKNYANPLVGSGEIPNEFECSITHAGEIMEDPVICVLDGQTYERKAIERWLKDNNYSPHNRIKLNAGQNFKDVLYENRNLKVLIEQFNHHSQKRKFIY